MSKKKIDLGYLFDFYFKDFSPLYFYRKTKSVIFFLFLDALDFLYVHKNRFT